MTDRTWLRRRDRRIEYWLRNVRKGREVDGPHSRFHGFMYWRDRTRQEFEKQDRLWREVIFEMNMRRLND